MLFLFISTALLIVLLAGIGAVFGGLFGLTAARNPWLYLWLGIFAASTMAMLASLFVPLNLAALVVFAVIGGTGLPILYREYKQSAAAHNAAEKKIWAYTAFLALFCLACLLAYTEWPGGASDTELYHAQTIRWHNEFGTPSGLGNLHTRLAFNSSWLSLAALFDNGLWDNRSEWIMPALMLAGGFFYFLYELCFAKQNGVRVYALCLILWLGFITLDRPGPHLYYDNPAHILNAVAVLEAYYLLLNPAGGITREKINHAAVILALGAGAFMVKPIGAVTVIFSGLLGLFLLWKNKKPSAVPWLKIYLPALCAFAVWGIKNIFLSGYVLYPLPILAVPVDWIDWTMPLQAVKNNYNAVLGWARMPGPDYLQSLEKEFLFWFKPWLAGNLRSKEFLAVIIFPLVFSAFFWFLNIWSRGFKKSAYFFAWSFLSIIYWFISAPGARFGSGFFWVSLGASLLFLIPGKPQFDFSLFWKRKKIRMTFFFVFGLGAAGGIGLNIFLPAHSLITIGTMPSLSVKEYVVEAPYPFSVWISAVEEEISTGNSPLPSAPGKVENIEMREPGNLGKGFRARNF